MKLSVLTLCPHIFHEGRWYSYEPFVREMDVWAHLFDRLVTVAPIETGRPPAFWAAYEASARVRVIPYRRDEGCGLEQSRTRWTEVPRMLAAILRGVRASDACLVRAPAAIGLLGTLLVPLVARRRVAKYAGQWTSYEGEPRSFRLQRALLGSRWWRAPVLVYGDWPAQPPWVTPQFTTVTSDAEMARARRAARRPRHGSPGVLFVGRLSPAKNVDVLLRALALLRVRGAPLSLRVVGDGPERARLEALAAELELGDSVRFDGALSRDEVLSRYEEADILVLSSETEGWPKALTEAMAFGLVCIGSRRGLIPHLLGEGRGYLVEPGDVAGLATALGVAADEEGSAPCRAAAAELAQRFTLEGLERALRELLATTWNLPPADLDSTRQ